MSGFCITRIVLFCNLLLFSLYLIMNVSLYHQALWQVTVSCGLTDKPSVSFKCRVFGQYVSSCYSSTSGAGMVFCNRARLSRVRLFVTPQTVPCQAPLSPWDIPGKNIGVGNDFLLQGIFLTQGSNRGLWHCRQILYRLSH